jgi:hypothetical protein
MASWGGVWGVVSSLVCSKRLLRIDILTSYFLKQNKICPYTKIPLDIGTKLSTRTLHPELN